jgi:elongation factor G
MMRERLGANPIPIQIPIGDGDMFNGLIDLIAMRGVVYNETSLGAEFEEIDIPKDLLAQAEEYRTIMLEAISDYDEELMMKYLDGEKITVDEVKSALRKATLDVAVVPVLAGSAFKNKGVQRLLDAVIDFLPSPLDVGEVVGRNPKDDSEIKRKADDEDHFSALAFKIMTDPYVGRLTFLRVYSGKLDAGSYIYNPNTGKKERVGRLLHMHANHREDLEAVYAGDICAAVGLKNTKTGDTLSAVDKPIVLEEMFFPEPVIRVAIEPKTKADQEKMGTALGKLSEEDPTFRVYTDEETGQTIIAGMGELHLEVLIDRMLREFKVEANIGQPQVAYKECIRRPAEAEGKFVRQSGGRGQFGHVVIEVMPNEAGKGYEFIDNIVGGVVPKEYIPSVSNGIQEAMRNGILAGYPVEDIKVRLFDGSFHAVDSSEMAFKIAGSMGFQAAVKKADPAIMEPVMDVEVVVPEEYIGDVIGDLNGRRGRVAGITPRKDAQVISATVPLAEMFGYATSLRSMTQGRAIYTMQFDHYEEVPKSVSEKIIEKNQQ